MPRCSDLTTREKNRGKDNPSGHAVATTMSSSERESRKLLRRKERSYWQILLQKSFATLLNDDSVALMRFALEAIDDGAAQHDQGDIIFNPRTFAPALVTHCWVSAITGGTGPKITGPQHF